jgi:ferredoxin-type protein NapH
LNKSYNRIKWYSALFLSLLFCLFALSFHARTRPLPVYPDIVMIGFAAVVSFPVFYLNYVRKIRWILFSLLSVLLVVYFATMPPVSETGLSAFSRSCTIPECNMEIINEIFAVPILSTLVGSSNAWGFYSSFLIWFMATLLIGKGWCSWVCYKGGLNNIFGSILKKPVFNISDKLAAKLRLLPFAILISVGLLSLSLMRPANCYYFCPFGTVDRGVDQFSYIMLTGRFLLFAFVFIILPLLFAKRIWCIYLCPAGALQSLIGRFIKIYRIKVDTSKCVSCDKCINGCLTRGITPKSRDLGKATDNCSLCMNCVEVCPANAIEVTIFGKSLNIKISIFQKLQHIRAVKILTNIIADILTPQSFLYFFALTFMFHFISGFYYGIIINLIK